MVGFNEIRNLLDKIMADGTPAHGAFWNGVTLEEFITRPVWGKIPIEIGHPESSNLILSLRGLPPFGTPFLPRMPKGQPPASEEDILQIEEWILAGCPEFSTESSNLVELNEIGDSISDQAHVEYWRAVDDFFLPGLASQETSVHVARMHGAALQYWGGAYISGQPETVWLDYIGRGDVRESFEYIRTHQNRLIQEFYEGKQIFMFDSIWKFGANLLPIDPLSRARPRHTMNGVLDWFYWVPQLDFTTRVSNLTELDYIHMRAWQVGIVADGLLRNDSQRPDSPENPSAPISDFDSADPNLKTIVFSSFENFTESELRQKMLSRAQDYFALIS
jgi:hypothetical protein